MGEPPKTFVEIWKLLDGVSLWTGRIFGWLIFPLIAVLVIEVAARKFFIRPTVYAYDMSYMLYGTLFMLGAPYTLYRKAHIRTDFLYRLWSPRAQGAVDAILYLFFFFPGIGLFLWVGWDFANTSWMLAERTVTSAWGPPIYPLKTIIPLTAGLLMLQGISEFTKCLYAALKGRWP